MKVQEYEEKVQRTALYPRKNLWQILTYLSLGLAGEAGEISNKMKKILRDDRGRLTQERRQQIRDELGDVLWYITRLANELGFSLEEIMRANNNKLLKRLQKNTLKGEGDNR